MGLCLSSRQVTVDNKDTDVLKVSAKVIARLRKENVSKGSKKPGPLDVRSHSYKVDYENIDRDFYFYLYLIFILVSFSNMA